MNLLATNPPLDVAEKQMLVETPSTAERAEALRLTLEMAVKARGTPHPTLH